MKIFWKPNIFFNTTFNFAGKSFCRPLTTSGRNNMDENVLPTPLIHIFGCGPFYKKFHQFLFHPGKIIRLLAAVSILRPLTFHIAHLKRYVHKFSGVPQKLTCCERFGLQLLPNSEECIFFTPERPFSGVVFGQREFSWPNGRLSPIA